MVGSPNFAFTRLSPTKSEGVSSGQRIEYVTSVGMSVGTPGLARRSSHGTDCPNRFPSGKKNVASVTGYLNFITMFEVPPSAPAPLAHQNLFRSCQATVVLLE